MEFQQRRRVDPALGARPGFPGFASGWGSRQDDRAGDRQRDRAGIAGNSPSGEVARLRGISARRRHSGIFSAVHRLDVAVDEATRQELAGWVREQYASEYGDIPIGFVAQCHLGPPYVDHRLDLVFSIVEHYAPADVVPDPFAAARMMVRTGGYEFVEVYASGQLVPVLADGTAVSS